MKLSVCDLVQGYDRNIVLDGVSLEAECGEVVALLGPNGSGKSTLIKTMCNIMSPISGRILIDGNELGDLDPVDVAKLISYVPQSSTAAVYTSVLDTVLLGRRPYISWSYGENDLDIAVEAMEAMEVDRYSDRFVSDLSGGQRQRVFLARSLAQDPMFYVFDEPTSALDLRHQMHTMLSMRDIVHRGDSGMIIALHDINLALNYTDKVVILKDKHVYASGRPRDVITESSIRDVYGVESRFVDVEGYRFILPMRPDYNFGDD